MLTVVCFLLTISGCTYTEFVDVRCRPLADYKRIKMVDYRTVEKVVYDSIQYREYLLSYSDTSDFSGISGSFLLEKIYQFDKGIVLIVQKESTEYEVLVISENKSNNMRKLVPGRCYQMTIRPYFLFGERAYAGTIRKAIYYKHYVIYPAYILRDESRICTADLTDIIECNKSNCKE